MLSMYPHIKSALLLRWGVFVRFFLNKKREKRLVSKIRIKNKLTKYAD